MREIKFRAWDKVNKEIYPWWQIRKSNPRMEYFEIEKLIIMQFTGVKDKNGKEIYEGDIIRHKIQYGDVNSEEITEVEWSEGVDGDNYINSGFSLWPSFENKDLEVIGNIYKNPELVDNV